MLEHISDSDEHSSESGVVVALVPSEYKAKEKCTVYINAINNDCIIGCWNCLYHNTYIQMDGIVLSKTV